MSDYELVYSDDPNFKKRCPKCSKYPCACPKKEDLKHLDAFGIFAILDDLELTNNITFNKIEELKNNE